MVELIRSFPFFLNLLVYPSALLEWAKQLLWPLSTGKHFPSAFLSSPTVPSTVSHPRLPPAPRSTEADDLLRVRLRSIWWRCVKATMGWFQEKHLTNFSGLMAQDPEPAASRASLWTHLSAISCLFWPGEGMRSPTRERRENGPDSDRSLVIASLVKFHKVSLTKHHMMQRSLGKVACSLPQHLSGWIMSLARYLDFLSLGTCEYNIIWK